MDRVPHCFCWGTICDAQTANAHDCERNGGQTNKATLLDSPRQAEKASRQSHGAGRIMETHPGLQSTTWSPEEMKIFGLSAILKPQVQRNAWNTTSTRYCTLITPVSFTIFKLSKSQNNGLLLLRVTTTYGSTRVLCTCTRRGADANAVHPMGVPELWLMSPYILHNFITRWATLPEPLINCQTSNHTQRKIYDHTSTSRLHLESIHRSQLFSQELRLKPFNGLLQLNKHAKLFKQCYPIRYIQKSFPIIPLNKAPKNSGCPRAQTCLRPKQVQVWNEWR